MNRREFLKGMASLPIFALQMSPSSRTILNLSQIASEEKPNILMLVFDTLSAEHVSLNGYQRQTTPNFTRFAAGANVYQNHYAGGNFTSPGTASLLTGTYPWTNRAFNLHGTVDPRLAQNNIFSAFDDSYYKVAYTHNTLVADLLQQFRTGIDDWKQIRELTLSDTQYSDRLFQNDYFAAAAGEWQNYHGNEIPGSLTLSFLDYVQRTLVRKRLETTYGSQYPRGIPNQQQTQFFLLEDVFDWLISELPTLPQPFLVYVHVLPPHYPYAPTKEFVDIFAGDGLEVVQKPTHFASEGHDQSFLVEQRRFYDEFIAFTDAEFGKFYDRLQENKLLENTLMALTSDHGELFERGIHKHSTAAIYQPLTHVPLIIKRAGQVEGLEVNQVTSCVDILPSLMTETAQVIPSWCEGDILPGFAEQATNEDKAAYSVEARSNPKLAPLDKATIAMVKGDYKLINNRGYGEHVQPYELYNLSQDPEEIEDLIGIEKGVANAMREEMDQALAEHDRV